MSIVIAVICASVLLPLGAWKFNRLANQAAAAALEATPMSGEVAGQHIREALRAELAAAGQPPPQRADGLEELWEASP